MSEKAMMETPKKYLVTGASGFIGRRLCEVLKQQNSSQTIKALMRKPALGPWDEVTLFDFKNIENQPLPADLTENIDTVFHLGGIAHTRPSPANPEEDYPIVNVQATARLLENAAKNRVKCFIYMSSVRAAGQPQDPYGRSKQMAEKIVLEYGQLTAMQVCVLRPALVYGPGVKGNLLTMLKGIDQGWFPPLPRLHNQCSLVSVDDVVSTALTVSNHPLANGKIYTITDGEIYSTNQLYEAMRLALGKSPSRIACPLAVLRLVARTGDFLEKLFLHQLPVNSRTLEKLIESDVYQDDSLQRELDWYPKYNFFQVLPSIIAGYYAGKGSARGGTAQ